MIALDILEFGSKEQGYCVYLILVLKAKKSRVVLLWFLIQRKRNKCSVSLVLDLKEQKQGCGLLMLGFRVC